MVEPKAGAVRTGPVDGQELVCVPADAFIMGGFDDDRNTWYYDEKPVRMAYLEGYWIGMTPVTVARYRVFCDVTGRAMPEAPRWGWMDDHPVVNVSWHDADAYCQWAGLALPTEAQWEKAARGSDGRAFPWGDDWAPAKAVCSVHPAGAHSTAPVGSLPAGASPYGCRDMAGNVWEWCADWYDEHYYASAPQRNPTGPATGTRRAARGASWYYFHRDYYRAAYRLSFDPAIPYYGLGFRVVLRQDSHRLLP